MEKQAPERKWYQKMWFANLLAGVIYIGLAVYAIAETFQFKKFPQYPVGPEVFPRAMACALILFSVILIVQSVRRALLRGPDEKAPSLSLRVKGMWAVLACVAAVAAIILLFDSVGLLIIGPVVLFLLMLLIGMRSWRTMILISVLLPLLLWLVFYKVLNISIPLGPLEMIYDVF